MDCVSYAPMFIDQSLCVQRHLDEIYGQLLVSAPKKRLLNLASNEQKQELANHVIIALGKSAAREVNGHNGPAVVKKCRHCSLVRPKY